MGVPARLGSDSTVAICVEDEGHNNWLQTFACCVWDSQASPRRDIPTSFRSSLILGLDCLHLDLDFINDCSMHDSLPRVCVNRESFLFFESLLIQVWLLTVLVV